MTTPPRPKKNHAPKTDRKSSAKRDQQSKLARTERTAQLAKFFDGDVGPERIAKKMARAGLCSRRDAELWIGQGRVEINGTTLETPAYNVMPEDVVTVDGHPLMKEEVPRLWRYYKPRGLVVSNRDEKDRETVFDALPPHLPRVISVGRLDLDSEGLLLLTNSGDLARVLELPDTGWTRKYRVRVRGRVNADELSALADGITIDGIHYRGILAQLDRQSTSNAWLTIALKEGKNREIRKVMDHLGYTVSRLIRTSYGPFQLNDMEEEAVEEVKPAVLRDQLGLPRDIAAEEAAAKTLTARKPQNRPNNRSQQRPQHNPRHIKSSDDDSYDQQSERAERPTRKNSGKLSLHRNPRSKGPRANNGERSDARPAPRDGARRGSLGDRTPRNNASSDRNQRGKSHANNQRQKTRRPS